MYNINIYIYIYIFYELKSAIKLQVNQEFLSSVRCEIKTTFISIYSIGFNLD